jgi:hypothetical protein
VGVAGAGFIWARVDWLLDVSKVASLLGLASAYGLWTVQRTLSRRALIVVDVSATSVRQVDTRGRERVLRRDEIASISDLSHGAGLAVRAVNPRKSLLIPPDLEDFDACRGELLSMGIPLMPTDRNRVRKVWAMGVVFWSFGSLLLVKSPAAEIACGVLCGGTLLALWAAGWLNPSNAGQSCPVPDRSPEEAARSRRKIQLWGMGITAAGIAIMMLEAWWTHGTDELGVGLFTLFTGVLVFAAGFFSGTVGASVLAFVALAASGAAIGGMTWWLRPASDLGSLIAISVGLLSSVVFVVTLLGRLVSWRPWVGTMFEGLFGPALIAIGVVEQIRGRGDHGVLVVVGILVTLFAIGSRNPRWRRGLVKIAFPLKLVALGVAFVGLFSGYKDLTWPVIVLWLLPESSADGSTATTS